MECSCIVHQVYGIDANDRVCCIYQRPLAWPEHQAWSPQDLVVNYGPVTMREMCGDQVVMERRYTEDDFQWTYITLTPSVGA